MTPSDAPPTAVASVDAHEAPAADVGASPVRRLRVRYAKRGRMRFASHRDIARAVERALRRARVPMAFSAGFSPRPKISYAGAAATGVLSEAEYLEIAVTRPCPTERVHADLNAALPTGLDVLEVVEAGPGALADRLDAAEWRVRLDGVDPEDAERAVRAFTERTEIEVERLTKKGRRRFDARAAVATCELDRRAPEFSDAHCAILRMVVRSTTPAVRPDDVMAALRQVADLAPPSPPLVTRLAQGPLDTVTGGVGDPLAADRTNGADDAAGSGWSRGT